MAHPNLRPQLAADAARQQGLVTRRQALAAGYSDDELRSLTRTRGAWIVVRRGVYTQLDSWAVADDRHRLRLRDLAAHLMMTTAHALSHDSAARGQGVPVVAARHQLTHVSRKGVGGSRTQFGVKHHLARRVPPDLLVAGGVPMTGLARTSLDLAREHGFAAGVVAVDDACHRGVPVREFERQVALMSHWPHVSTARAAWAFADAGAESPGESLSRILLAELGLGPLLTTIAGLAGDRIVWCDLRVGCHVVEFDGRVKYRDVAHGGVATRNVDELIWEEKKRQIEVCGVGLGMSRLVWEDLWGAARERAKRRLASEYSVTRQRWGCELPSHLAEFDARHPRLPRISRV